jgi:hypothetical protein
MAEIISPIPPLDPSEEVVIHTTWYYDPENIPVIFDLEAIADYGTVIAELDESNNNLIKEFTEREPRTTPFTSSIIVHAHNPEGKEISSLSIGAFLVEIYANGSLIGYADGVTSHIIASAGHYLIEVKWNGMVESQEVDLVGSEKALPTELTFVFARTVLSWKDCCKYTNQGSISGSGSLIGLMYGGSWQDLFRSGSYPYICYSSALYESGSVHDTAMVNIIASTSLEVTDYTIDFTIDMAVSGVLHPGWRLICETGTDVVTVTPHISVPVPSGFTNWYKQDTLPTYSGPILTLPGESEGPLTQAGSWGWCSDAEGTVHYDTHILLDEFNAILASVPY